MSSQAGMLRKSSLLQGEFFSFGGLLIPLTLPSEWAQSFEKKSFCRIGKDLASRQGEAREEEYA